MLERLSGAWKKVVGPASRSALLALVMAVLLAGAHLARLGTGVARGAVAALLALSLLALALRWWLERRAWRSARRTVARVLLATDPALGQRTLRALSLVERTARDASAGSAELAQVHLERLVASASLDRVSACAARRASRWRMLGFALMVLALGALFVSPARVVEGLDVLAARHGLAPMKLAWLDSPRVSAQLPSYLRASGSRLLFPGEQDAVPVGTQLVFRGVPVRDGRSLRVTDGAHEVPFVSDGAGGVVARWTLDKSVRLRVAARFGKVLVEEPDSLVLVAVADEAPKVVLETAPRTVKLADVGRLELRYAATDDHGLRQVDLVLRSGASEDRRTLSRLDGDSTTDRGGYALAPRDEFLRRMFLPVTVTVEARDNDPINGSKWGKSAAITIVPPSVGEPEAARFAALVALRSKIVDLLAGYLATDKPREDQPATRHIADAVRATVGDTFGGLGVSGGLSAFLIGQARILERRPKTGESVVRKTEDVLLAFDVALRGLALRDARVVAGRLGDVAEEAANGAKLARETEKQAAGIARLDVAIGALDAGARELAKLGALGRDLGGVALGDLGRIKNARGRQDMMHTELAALHLAARLRRPDPSFGSARTGGVESGAGSSPAAGDASQAADHFNQLAGELRQLADDHAAGMDAVEHSLAEAEQSVDLDTLRDEAKRHAEAIRQAASQLPLPGAEPGTARAAGALGREHAAAMAQALERLSLDDAVKNGRDAQSALADAQKKAANGDRPGDWIDREEVADARRRLGSELSWAEQQLDKLKQQAQARARGALEKSGEGEQGLARRAGNLAGRGKNGETAFPGEVIDALQRAEGVMREAGRELANGRGDRGLELQRQAQRLLERASTGKTTDSSDKDEGKNPQNGDKQRGSNGKALRTDGDVPRPGDARSAEDFRRRVLRGLGKDRGGRLSPAVRRYAEGLLK